MTRVIQHSAAIIFIVLIASAIAQASDLCSSLVPTSQGLVSGAAVEDSPVCVYKGIPYAAPPVGEWRWSPPQDTPVRSEVLPALSFSGQCMQSDGPLAALFNEKGMKSSEDCLYLNIWRPMKSGSFPVMVWIHGGGFTKGTGATPIYWGDRLAEKHDVVVVSINYRLGPLGFLLHRGLADENPGEGSGNYGILDQIKALEWVKKNIESFGGDPCRVTIFGESAGGFSVCALLASPLAKGLFQRAIMQSGSCEGAKSEKAGFADGDRYAEALGCPGPEAAECLRNKPARELIGAVSKVQTDLSLNIDAFYKTVFLPHVDGHALMEKPIAALRSGRFNNVPLIVGTNRDEMMMFALRSPGFLLKNRSQVDEFIADLVGDENIGEFKRLYPYSAFRRPADAAIAALGDLVFGCPSLEAAGAVSDHSTPVYLYRFDYDRHRAHMFGAPHGFDNIFIFGDIAEAPFKYLFNHRHGAEARGLSETMMTYWTNFARNGDPNGAEPIEWPEYNRDTRRRLHLDEPVHAEIVDNAEKCEFWGRQGIGFE